MAKVLVVPNDPPSPSWEAVAEGFSARHEVRVAGTDHPRLQEYMEWKDLPVFHVDGNSRRSGAVYRLAVEHPGLVALHDLDLEELVRALVRDGDPLAEAALREAGADRARLSGEELGGNNRQLTPWCAQLVRRSRAVVSHSAFTRRYLEATRCRTPVFVAPHPVPPAEVDGARPDALRSELPSNDFVVAALCDPSAAAWIGALVAAVEAPARLVVVGSAAEIAGTAENVTVPDPASRAEIGSWVSAADAVVNLGHPMREEARSFTAAAQAAGKGAVLTAAWFREGVPEDAALRVNPMPASEELRNAIAFLRQSALEREAMGGRLREDGLARCTPEAAADVYTQAVAETIALLDDPVRSALSRWGSGLAECGATIDLARQGLGARFADEIAALADAR
jgi:hypothetical protein